MKKLLLLSFFLVHYGLLSAQWIPTEEPVTYWSLAIDGLDKNTAWAGGVDFAGGGPSTALLTTDGGQSWTISDLPIGNTQWPLTIFAQDSTTAFIGTYAFQGGTAYVFRTQDSGITWDTMDINQVNHEIVAGIHFYNPQEGFILSDIDEDDNGFAEKMGFFQTTDGGDTWTRHSDFPSLNGDLQYLYNNNSCWEIKDDYIWIGTFSGKILRSKDRGVTWESIQTPLQDATTVAFRDSLNGIIAETGNGTGTGINGEPTLRSAYRTSDGGNTWLLANIPNDVETIEYVPNSGGVYIATQGYTGKNYYYISTDDGHTWKEKEVETVWDVDFIDNGTAWATGFEQGSGIMRYVEQPLNASNEGITVHTAPYVEDFENGHPDCYEFGGYAGMSNYTFNNGDYENRGAVRDSDFAGAIYTPDFGWTYTHIQTAPIYLDQGYRLSFDAFYTNLSTQAENADVSISTDHKQTWTELFNFEEVEGESWLTHYLSLEAYQGDTIYLSFNYANPGLQGIGGLFIDDINISQATSTNDLSLQNPISVFPNPSTNFINVQIDPAINNDASIQLISMDGKILKSIQTANNALITIDVQHLASGIYLVEYNDGNRRYSKRIFKK